MSKVLRCGDLMKVCQLVFKAETEQEVLQKAGAHAKNAHNIQNITPDLLAKVKSAIRTV